MLLTALTSIIVEAVLDLLNTHVRIAAKFIMKKNANKQSQLILHCDHINTLIIAEVIKIARHTSTVFPWIYIVKLKLPEVF